MVQDFLFTLYNNGVLLIMSEMEMYHKLLKTLILAALTQIFKCPHVLFKKAENLKFTVVMASLLLFCDCLFVLSNFCL